MVTSFGFFGGRWTDIPTIPLACCFSPMVLAFSRGTHGSDKNNNNGECVQEYPVFLDCHYTNFAAEMYSFPLSFFVMQCLAASPSWYGYGEADFQPNQLNEEH